MSTDLLQSSYFSIFLIVALACLIGVGLKYLFDIDTPSLVGLIAGALTSIPGLAAADSMTDSNIPGVAYAIVGIFTGYP